MAAVTWTSPTTSTGLPTRAKGVAASGTATDAPTLATEGLGLGAIASYDIVLEADDTRTLNGTGTLICYRYWPDVGWTLDPGGNITYASITGVRRATIRSGNSPGPGEPVINHEGRILWVPSSVTVSAGGITIYLNGQAAARAVS